MYYIITDRGVYSGSSCSQINKRHGIKIEAAEFTSVGADYVTCVTNKNIEFLEDKARLSQIMFGNFFKKDSMPTILTIINIILTFIVLVAK